MLSRRARWALVAMLDVARMARGRPLPARALAARGGTTPRQFETVLQDLVRAGLLRSIRGPNGGYELARERRRISAGDIVRASDPPREAANEGPGDAAIEGAVSGATAAFLAHLDTISLDSLCQVGAPAAGAAPAADFTI